MDELETSVSLDTNSSNSLNEAEVDSSPQHP